MKTISCLSLLVFLASVSLLTVRPAGAQSFFGAGGQLETVVGGFQFTEGPVWRDTLGLFFSDINGNTIYRWSPQSGVVTVLKPSGNANGLTFDHQGRLVAAQQGGRRVIRIEHDGLQTILAERYNGKRLNSPNDLVVKSDGSIWFTDPPYGISSAQEELGFYGIYRIDTLGHLQLLDKSLQRPNGIVFSRDETKVYVNDSEARRIYVWDIVSDSAVGSKRQFAFMAPAGYADGMKVDSAGNLFSAGPLGVWVFAPDGKVLDTILVPGQTTNCAWGDADRKTLYITAGTTVYRIRLPVTHVGGRGDGWGIKEGFDLYPNYPNPFNPATMISFRLPVVSNIKLVVYDMLGREVTVLVEGWKVPGIYTARFDGKGLASGVYYCSLSMSEFSSVRTMMLVR